MVTQVNVIFVNNIFEIISTMHNLKVSDWGVYRPPSKTKAREGPLLNFHVYHSWRYFSTLTGLVLFHRNVESNNTMNLKFKSWI